MRVDDTARQQVGSNAAYPGSCAASQQRGCAVACPLPGSRRGKLPGMPTVASPFGKGAYVPRKLGIGVAGLLLAAIAVPSVLFATQGNTGQEARVAAYKHEDGRVEFAIQVREGNTWGERLLPRGRTLGTNARTGRWLTSTPVTLPSSSSATGEFVPVVIGLPPDTFDLDHGEVAYGSGWFGDYGWLQTTIETRDAHYPLQNGRIERTVLRLHCNQGAYYGGGGTFSPDSFRASVSFYVHGPYGYPQYLRDYHSHGRGNEEGVWDSTLPAVAFLGYRTNDGDWDDHDILWWRGSLDFDREFMHELRQYARLAVYIGVREDGELSIFGARFDNLQELFSTPLQDNINRCGEYPVTWEYTGPVRPTEDYAGEGA